MDRLLEDTGELLDDGAVDADEVDTTDDAVEDERLSDVERLADDEELADAERLADVERLVVDREFEVLDEPSVVSVSDALLEELLAQGYPLNHSGLMTTRAPLSVVRTGLVVNVLK